jgi:hypothetical protein
VEKDIPRKEQAKVSLKNSTPVFEPDLNRSLKRRNVIIWNQGIQFDEDFSWGEFEEFRKSTQQRKEVLSQSRMFVSQTSASNFDDRKVDRPETDPKDGGRSTFDPKKLDQKLRKLENPVPEAEPSNLRTTMPKRGLGLRSKSKSKAEAQQDSRKTVANNPKPAPRIESLPERTQTEPLKNNTQDFLEKLNLDTQQKKDILDVVQKDMLGMISEFKREFGSIIQPLTQQVARVSERVNSMETDHESLDQKLKQMWEFCDSTNLKMPEIVISFKDKKICYDLNYKI